ncbi:putative nucleic acid-binding protein [Paenarthrobacter nicotinovorans]|uniref:PIN domain-containing protein n=1 Tax=Paenarthrobacter nicotinovorans TaxID=29320 RepID=UPI0027861B6D|nr:PIN domain-containing protein [Paenarthrobacter nicotinovorans]MDP9935014.1 putative nucleic acid-binding protein [Paenarthrobacter nicotinovorans]
MAFRVLIDACVLLPYQLCDLLLRLGETDIYQPLWSDQILEEVERNLVTTLGRTEQQAARRVGQMRKVFPHATVSGYEALVPAMTNDPKDRHVLAAAIHGQAALIVTANLKDFPAEALAPYGIEAVHPDEFLLDQLDLYPQQTTRCLQQQRAAYRNPSFTRSEFYNSLSQTAPQFAVAAQESEGAGVYLELVAGTAHETVPGG